jgi:hypothetical protein
MTVVFVEMAGAEARDALAALAERLEREPSCVALRLLESRETEGLYLLELDWRGETLPELPPTARVWSFTQSLLRGLGTGRP